MGSLKGVEESFDECLKIAPIFKIEDIEIPILHINHLIANKKKVNRSKDQLDVIELEKIKKLRDEMNPDPNRL
jgi:hypothetical protein